MSLLTSTPKNTKNDDKTAVGQLLQNLTPDEHDHVLTYLRNTTTGHRAISEWLTQNGHTITEDAVANWRRKNGVRLESA